MNMPSLDKVKGWWLQRPPKERWLLGGASALLVIGLSDALWLGSMRRDIGREGTQLAQRTAMLDNAREKQNAHIGVTASDTASANELLARVRLGEQRLSALQAQAAESSRLPEMLRALTLTVGTTHLLALDLSPGTAGPRPTGPGSGLHRLPVSMKVGGSWSELHLLLTQVERHAQPLQWSQFTLDAARWPAIELTLKGHAISPHPHWGHTP